MHIHADKSANGRFTGESECFSGDDVLEGAKGWLMGLMASDFIGNEEMRSAYERATALVDSWDGSTEAVEAVVAEPYCGTVIYCEYRLMYVHEACERTMADA
jgi:hypothetical protein